MKKLIKKLTAVVMSGIMVLGIAVPMYAEGLTYATEVFGITSLVEVNGFVFEVTESVDEYHRVTRVIERSMPSVDVRTDNAEVEALLQALGKDYEDIVMMSYDDLQIFATSPFIVSTSSNFVTGSCGTVRYVTEEYAIEYAKFIEDARFTYLYYISNNTMLESSINSGPPQFDNGVVRVQHTIARVGNSESI